MKITFDPEKRDRTLEERGLDFADAAEVFGGITFDRIDDRKDYGEPRIITAPRGEARHVFSMRKANDREKARFGERLAKG